MVRIEIVNVVATASLEQQIEFDELRTYKEIFHDSDVYERSVAYSRLHEMTGKVSIFLSGKMISVEQKASLRL